MSTIPENYGQPSAGRGRATLSPLATTVLRQAVEQFEDLAGWKAGRLTGVRPTESGWSLLVDVVEVERVPDTTSVLATYRVDLNTEGGLISYERLRRYTRNATDPS
jgi:Gas vesicle synthesis protein GvpO